MILRIRVCISCNPAVLWGMETKKTRKANLARLTAVLVDIEQRHAEGEPVYAEMAARIAARTESPYQDETDTEVFQNEMLDIVMGLPE